MKNRAIRRTSLLFAAFPFGALLFASGAQARDNADLFVTPKTLSMGRAMTAIADDFNALNTNPAGLAAIEKGEGQVRAPEIIMITASPSIKDLIKTLHDLDPNQSVPQQLASFDGKSASLGVNALGFGWYRHRFAISINIADVNSSFRVRVPSLLFAKINGRTTVDSGISIGYGIPLMDGKLRIGATVRPFMVRGGFNKEFQTQEILDLREGNTIQLLKNIGGMGWGFDADIGVQGHLDNVKLGGMEIKPMYGAVFQNLLGQDFGHSLSNDFSGPVPKLERKLNVGIAGTVENLGSFKPTLSIDYRNIFVRTSGVLERLAIGLELGLHPKSWFTTAFRGHFANGQLGGGVGIKLGPADIELGTYAVNLGNGIGVGVDRRLYAKISMVW